MFGEHFWFKAECDIHIATLISIQIYCLIFVQNILRVLKALHMKDICFLNWQKLVMLCCEDRFVEGQCGSCVYYRATLIEPKDSANSLYTSDPSFSSKPYLSSDFLSDNSYVVQRERSCRQILWSYTINRKYQYFLIPFCQTKSSRIRKWKEI